MNAPVNTVVKPKNPEFILGLLASYVNTTYPSLDGLNTRFLQDGYFEVLDDPAFAASLILRQRSALEEDKNFLHPIPYVAVFQLDDLGRRTHLLVYRRTKLVGEQRLAGNTSAGVGGHIDLPDVSFKEDNSLDWQETLTFNILRELDEEVKITDTDGNRIKIIELVGDGHAFLTAQGLIKDLTNSVGSVHLGLLYSLDLQPGLSAVIGETELEQVGMISLEVIKNERDKTGFEAEAVSKFENWTQILAEAIREDRLSPPTQDHLSLEKQAILAQLSNDTAEDQVPQDDR